MKPKVMDGFEGNPQSFRIVTKTAAHREGHDGLNLTRETLCAILKYPWYRSTEVKDDKHRKWGSYHSEKDDFNFARKHQPSGSENPCIEAQILTWADDITYSVHDIEDFYQAGLIPLDRLSTQREADRFLSGVSERWQRKGIKSPYNLDELGKVLERLFRLFPLSEPYTGERKQQAALRSFSQSLIDNYIAGTKLRDPQASGQALVRDDNLLMEVEILKELLWFYVIKNPALATQEYGQGQMIEKLFSIIVGAVSENKPDRWNILPGRAREFLRELGANAGDEDRHRIAVDTIAGMTEQQVLQMFHRLTGVSPGSLFQPIVL
jgi:dGTPase